MAQLLPQRSGEGLPLGLPGIEPFLCTAHAQHDHLGGRVGQRKLHGIVNLSRRYPSRFVDAACARLGVDMVEIDVRETADGQLVLLHDASLERMTDGAGRLSQTSLARFRTLRLREGRGGPGARLTSLNPPTLREALRAAKGKVMLNLDAKQADNKRQACTAVAATLPPRQHPCCPPLILLSTSSRPTTNARLVPPPLQLQYNLLSLPLLLPLLTLMPSRPTMIAGPAPPPLDDATVVSR